jgi:hypothetical protein
MQSVPHLRWTAPAEVPDDAPTLPRIEAKAEPEERTPDWIREAARKYAFRIRDWAAQTWMLTHSPRRFVSEWTNGTREALNPLRFLAVGTTLMVLAERGARWVIHLAPLAHEGWTGWLRGSIADMLSATVMGALMHIPLRFRSGATFRSSLGAVIFATGGPGAVATALGWLVCVALYLGFGHVPLFPHTEGTPVPLPVVFAGMLGSAWTALTMAAVHRVRWWIPFLALIGAITVLTLVSAIAALVVAKGLGH